jgi:hypothetical protein
VLCNLKKAYSRICSPRIRHHVHGPLDPDIPRQHSCLEISEFDYPLTQCYISEENPQRRCLENCKTYKPSHILRIQSLQVTDKKVYVGLRKWYACSLCTIHQMWNSDSGIKKTAWSDWKLFNNSQTLFPK